MNYIYSVPYLLVFFLLAFFSIRFSGECLELNRKVSGFYCFLIMVLFFGLRGYVFSDWISYTAYYKNVPDLFDGFYKNLGILTSNFFGFESGFNIFSSFIKSFFDGYFTWQFIQVLLDFIILYYVFEYFIPENISFGFLCFFAFYGLLIEVNLLRNVKAILLFLVSLKYINSSWKKYFLLNLLGCFFHISAIFYFLFYVFYKIKWNRKFLFAIFLLGNLFFVLQVPFLKNSLESISSFLPERLGVKIINYLNKPEYNKSYGFGLGFFERNINFLIFYYYNKKNNDETSELFFISYFVYISIFLFCSEFSIIVERIPYLFAFSYWLFFPYIYEKVPKKEKILLIVWVLGIGFLKLLVGNGSVEMRYETLFNIHHKGVLL